MEKIITKTVSQKGGISPSGKYYYHGFCFNSKWRVRIKIYNYTEGFSARNISFEEIKEMFYYDILSEKLITVNF